MEHREAQEKRPFPLAQWIVAIVVGLLFVAVFFFPVCTSISPRSQYINALANIRSITIACLSFESEWGRFPDFDPQAAVDGEEPEIFSTSTEVFDLLIPAYIDAEKIFWVKTEDPKRQRPPNEDGLLESHENVYLYVAGLTTAEEDRNSPLIADGLMESPGHYGEFHPWLKERRALVGFAAGHATEMPLTSKRPSATVQSQDGAVTNLFEPRGTDENGQATGGWLPPETGRILLPE